MQTKLIKLADDDWGWDMAEFRVTGFPTIAAAIEWHTTFLVKMITQPKAAEDKMLDALMRVVPIGARS